MKEGYPVLMTKYAGLSGTIRLLRQNEEKMRERFPGYFLEKIYGLSELVSMDGELSVLKESDKTVIVPVGEYGVFGALWELCEKCGCGIEADLRKITIRQETVELCNELDVNPYEMEGDGSFIAAFPIENLPFVIGSLQKERIPFSLIGQLKEGKERILVNKTEKRYLTPTERIRAEKRERGEIINDE